MEARRRSLSRLAAAVATLLCAATLSVGVALAPAVAAADPPVAAAADATGASGATRAGAPPTVSVSGVPDGWTGVPVTVTLAAAGAGSPVASIEYRVAGSAAWVLYTGPFIVSAEGATAYECRATDETGAVSAPLAFTVHIDLTGPVTTCFAATGSSGHPVQLPFQVDDALSPQATGVTLIVSDRSGAEVARVDAGTVATGRRLSVAWTPPVTGAYRVRATARDLAGNPQSRVAAARLSVPGPWWSTIGHSVRHRPIVVASFGSGARRVLIIGGTHGNESGTAVATRLAAYLGAHPEVVPDGSRIDIIRCLNPDGYARHLRGNARNVDLNRNLPTRNWKRRLDARDEPGHPELSGGRRPGSEPESRALLAYLRLGWRAVVALHSRAGILDCDGPGARALGRRMSALCGLPVGRLSYDAYITGSLGHYVPEVLHRPVVTVELRGPAMSSGLRDALLAPAAGW